jgi:hypothetical protein
MQYEQGWTEMPQSYRTVTLTRIEKGSRRGEGRELKAGELQTFALTTRINKLVFQQDASAAQILRFNPLGRRAVLITQVPLDCF